MSRLSYGLILMALVPCSGCAAVAVGGAAAGGVAYLLGDVERTYPYPIDVVWQATLAAMNDLELSPGHQAKDQLKGEVVQYSATRDKIRVRLASQGSMTRLNLRVNAFGNEQMSVAVLSRIEQHLPVAFGERAGFTRTAAGAAESHDSAENLEAQAMPPAAVH